MMALIEAFNKIRTVPYKIVDIEYSLDNSHSLINSQGASCTPKHIVLDEMIKSLGFETRFCVHEFKWSSFNLNFPKELSDLINPSQIDFHTNLEIKIINEWMMVDATWDDDLIDAGFPGTKIWNGAHSTLNCVVSLNKFTFNSLKERSAFLKTRNNSFDNESEFMLQLNKYLESIRNKRVVATNSDKSNGKCK